MLFIFFFLDFTQEYNRLVQAPLCCESRSLPDAETLRDRMMLIAYEEGMIDGVDGSGVANLLSNAMDVSLFCSLFLDSLSRLI